MAAWDEGREFGKVHKVWEEMRGEGGVGVDNQVVSIVS